MTDRKNLTGRRDLTGLTGKRAPLTAPRDLSGLTGRRQEPTPDPLATVEYSGDLAQDAAAELTAVESAYRERAKTEQSRFTAATDSEYWVAICFTGRAEKEQFLQDHGLDHLGDKYLNGREVDRALRRR